MGREDFEGLVPPAMRTRRTKMQEDANQLDLEVYRLIDKLRTFGAHYRENDVLNMASTLGGLRYRVRRHMHKADRERTS
jgi:hypothetical protein